MDRVLGRVAWPQSWNRLAYAGGNPLKFVDADGRIINVPESMRGTINDARRRSATFRATYDAIHADARITVGFTFQPRPLPGSRMHTEMRLTRSYDRTEMRVVADVQATVHVPVGSNDRIPEIGHELTHVKEVQDTGRTLAERYDAGEPNIWPNGRAYESRYALDQEAKISAELAATPTATPTSTPSPSPSPTPTPAPSDSGPPVLMPE